MGFSDCTGGYANGCETKVSSDTANCGACGRACSTTNVTTLSCAGGICNSSCHLNSMNYQTGNCIQPQAPTPDDGCETVVYYNSLNCGSCGNICPAGTNCFQLACQACGGTGAGCNSDSNCCSGGCDQFGCGCCN
jgi:hypothetical protein